MNIEVSVILISHNIYPQNLFTLYSLENQKYDFRKMEVILVDDCSTDKTTNLEHYKAPFSYQYLRSNVNLGRSGAKNFGLKETTGKIIIFLDGEVMVDPNFVSNHARHYEKDDQIVVTGSSSQFSTYSVIHYKFDRKHLRHLFSFPGAKPLLQEALAKDSSLPSKYKQNINGLLRYVRRNKKIVPLLSRRAIADESYKQVTYPAPNFPEVTDRYNGELTGYHLAWTFFITRSVSVSKTLLDTVGLFNEEFKGWGYEDWELGLRLYKKGAKFIEDREVISYHQEHPVSRKDKWKETVRNYLKLVTLHPQIEASALIFGIIGKRRFLKVNAIIDEYYFLEQEYPKQFTLLKNSFIMLAQSILFLQAKGKPVTRLLQHIGFEEDQRRREKEMLFNELSELKKTGRYGNLISAFELLLEF